VVSPCHDAAGGNQHENRENYNVASVPRPELQQIVSTKFFVDLAENVAHKSPGRPPACTTGL
jgi:hypothetical protein